jgi:hypothetical protein
VIKLTGYGEKRMREAIAQGLVEGEMRSDMERTLRKRLERVEHGK